MPAPPKDLLQQAYDLTRRMNAVQVQFNGDATRSRREFETLPSLNGRINLIEDGMWNTTSAPTETFKQNYTIAA